MSIAQQKILVATDGSEDAALALRAAIDLSNKTRAQLHVVHSWRRPQAPSLARPGLAYPSPEAEGYSNSLEREAKELLKEQVGLVREAGGNVAEAHLREGRPADEIAALAGELEADLVIVGSRGIGTVKRLATGSVSEGVVRLSPCPVLVMRGGEGAWPPARVVIGDDSSEEAKRAGELAAGLGELFGASALLLRAASLPLVRAYRLRAEDPSARKSYDDTFDEISHEVKEALENRAATLEGVLGSRPQIRVAVGDAAAVIQEAAEEDEGPALVAVGSRGSDAVQPLALGSISTDVLRAMSTPVLIVPASE